MGRLIGFLLCLYYFILSGIFAGLTAYMLITPGTGDPVKIGALTAGAVLFFGIGILFSLICVAEEFGLKRTIVNLLDSVLRGLDKVNQMKTPPMPTGEDKS